MAQPMQAPAPAAPYGGEAAAELARLLDAIGREFGSVVDGLSEDPHVRNLLANQLARRGARVGPAPVEVTLEETADPGLAEIVGGLQLQVDALWRELQRVQREVAPYLVPVAPPDTPGAEGGAACGRSPS